MTTMLTAVTRHDPRFASTLEVLTALQPSYPVVCVRPDLIAAEAERFMRLFPGTVMYAVKCNPHPRILRALHRGGIRHFDTASLPEIALVNETLQDSTAYFMHPVKSRAAIKTAYTVYGMRHFVIDHENELTKLLEEAGPDITVFVRLRTGVADNTLFHLSAKFGAEPEHAARLLREVERQGCRPAIAFHVGSQCLSPDAYGNALALVGEVLADAGVEVAAVDVGGGFPAHYGPAAVPRLETYMEAIREGIARLELAPGTRAFAEPGRALAAAGCSLLTQVQLRKGNQLYINDGVYGSLSECRHLEVALPSRVLRLSGEVEGSSSEFFLNGPTCDPMDVLPQAFTLPADVREGDWIELDQAGAYTTAVASNFNGFHPETFVEVFDAPPASTS